MPLIAEWIAKATYVDWCSLATFIIIILGIAYSSWDLRKG